jgi:uncharacterized protein DUF620
MIPSFSRNCLAPAMALGVLALAPATRLAAADEALPKAESILDKYIELTGGKAAYEKRHREISSGTMEIVGKGIKGTVTSYRAEPDKSYTVVDIEGIGKIEEGSDGKVAWALSAMQGPRVKEGEERTTSLNAGKFNAEMHWRDVYKKAETTGVETVDGQDCYKVLMTPHEGSPITRFYDKKSNLLVKLQMTMKSPMGELAVESIMSDYRKEGDILMPHRVTQKAAGQEIAVVIESVKFNPEIPPGRFDPPGDIKALLAKPH